MSSQVQHVCLGGKFLKQNYSKHVSQSTFLTLFIEDKVVTFPVHNRAH